MLRIRIALAVETTIRFSRQDNPGATHLEKVRGSGHATQACAGVAGENGIDGSFIDACYSLDLGPDLASYILTFV
jgi:predicted HD phosphohydrolase